MFKFFDKKTVSEKDFNSLADELDKMLIEMCKPSWDWNYVIAKSHLVMVKVVCKRLNDFELYNETMKELILKKFWSLPNNLKWQPLSLMKDFLSNGNIMNQVGNSVQKKIPKSELLKMLKECPNSTAKKIYNEFLVYYKQSNK